MNTRRSFISPFWDLFTEFDESTPRSPASAGASPASAAPAPGPQAAASPHFDEDSIHWAFRDLPLADATQHMLVCGTTGSGKTIAIRLFLQSIARRFHRDRQPPEQLILFDAKGDAIPLLAAMGLPVEAPNVWLINPYDVRSKVWNISEAVRTPVMARHLAHLLVPPEPNSNAPYFTDAARELVYAVILGLNHVALEQWTLRDLLCALESREHIEAVSARQPRAEVLAQRILRDTSHSNGVLSTLGSKLGRFEQAAALWDANPHPKESRFSIPDFLKRPGVLILGNDPLLRDSFWPINAMLLKALSHEILRGPETRQPRHWFVLDEFRAMEQVDCIHDLLNRGRSKGAAVLLGVQSIEGLIQVYGEHAANDLLSQCSYKTFLRLGDPRTAQWAEALFGRVRELEPNRLDASGYDADITGKHQHVQERSLFIASYFLSLPLPRPGGPYVCVSDLPALNATFITQRPFNQVLARLIPPSGDAEVQPFPDPQQLLRPWTPEEELKFYGPPKAGSPNPNTDPASPQPEPNQAKPRKDLSSQSPLCAFTSGQFKRCDVLARKLNQRADPVSDWLMDRFSPQTRKAIADYFDQRTKGEGLARLLLRELNAVVRGELIWDRERFRGVTIQPDTRALLAAPPDPKTTARLNQYLLQDAYPMELPQRQSRDQNSSPAA